MYGYFKQSISDKKMAKTMYAILRTGAKLVNSHHPSLNQCTRKQSSGFIVDVVIDIDNENVNLFEELAGVKLKTNEQFQGRVVLNK